MQREEEWQRSRDEPGDMRKIWAIAILFAAFVIVLVFYILPLQGGLNSSTGILANELSRAEQQYQEQLPIQEVDLGRSGRSIVIASVLLTHVIFANLYLGGAWIIAFTAFMYFRYRTERYKHLARFLALFNLIIFAVGATFAATVVFFFLALFPQFASISFHIFGWPLFIEALLFIAIVFSLYAYWFSWDRIGPGWHVVLGFAFPAIVFFQTLAIDTFASGMLTPGASSIAWQQSGYYPMPFSALMAWWFNPTLLPLQLHRVAAAISFFGFLMTFLGMLHYTDRKKWPAQRYWDWVGSYGILWGVLGLILQPVIGLFYMYTIFTHSTGAFSMIMTGPRAWEMLLMVGLLSILFLWVIVYFIERRRALLRTTGRTRVRRLQWILAVVAGIAGFILVQPPWLGSISRYDTVAWTNPLGAMYFKLIALLVLIGIGAIVLGTDLLLLRRSRETDWGHLPRTSRIAGIFAGVLGAWIIIAMGFVRESSRSPWLIYQIVPVPGMMAYPTPVPAPIIFLIWAGALAFAFTIFWFVSKATAYHPERLEEV